MHENKQLDAGARGRLPAEQNNKKHVGNVGVLERVFLHTNLKMQENVDAMAMLGCSKEPSCIQLENTKKPWTPTNQNNED